MRQMSGANDMLDVRAATFSREKVLKVGLANAQGADLPTIANNIRQQIQIVGIQASKIFEGLKNALQDNLKDLDERIVRANARNANLTDIGRFILQYIWSPALIALRVKSV